MIYLPRPAIIITADASRKRMKNQNNVLNIFLPFPVNDWASFFTAVFPILLPK